MSAHETRVDGDTLYVANVDGDWLEIGTFEDIYEVLGGDTVDVEYQDEAATFGAPWLDVNDDNVLTIEVRETLIDMTFPPVFVEKLAARDVGGAGVPERTAYFAESMERVWQSGGSLPDDENPFVE